MKKIMSLMLGLTLVLGSVSFVFGQDAPPPDDSKKDTTKKKKKKKDGDDTTKRNVVTKSN